MYLRLAGDGVVFPRGSAAPPTPDIPRGCPPPPSSLDKRALRISMINAFSVSDLEMLCADIEQDLRDAGIDTQLNLELIGGTNKPAQVLNLIGHLDRRGWLGCLVRAVERARPGLLKDRGDY